jgi:HK97 family phage prohead protease
MSRKVEYRGTNIRPHDVEKRIYAARVVNYGPPDSHGTSWAPGVFAESLKRKMPKSVWSHDPARPIGKVVEFRDTDEGLDVMVQFADLDSVPDARMAYSLLKDEIIDEFSFAFYREADEPDPDHPGVTRITRARISEVSPVLTASGQGTGTLAVRSEGTLSRGEADDILRRVAAGELDAQAALAELAARREIPKGGVEIRCDAKEDADAIREFLESTGRQVGFVQSAENGKYILEATVTTREVAKDEEPPVIEPRAATPEETAEEEAEIRALESLLSEEDY